MSIYIVPVELTANIQVNADSIEDAVSMVEDKSKHETIHLMTAQGEFNVGCKSIQRVYIGSDGELKKFKGEG